MAGAPNGTSTITSGPADAFDPAPLAGEIPDEREIKRFYDHYQPILTRYATRQGSPDPEGIADLAFFDGLRSLSTMRTPTEIAFRAFLYQAAKNRMISEARRLSFELTTLPPEHLVVGKTPDPAGTVADEILVDGLLDSLTTDQRKVIHHRFFEGHTAVETAARMGKSPGAVRKMQHDALVRLRRVTVVAGLLVVAVVIWLAVGALRDGDGRHRVIVEPVGDGGGTLLEPSVPVGQETTAESGPALPTSSPPSTSLPARSTIVVVTTGPPPNVSSTSIPRGGDGDDGDDDDDDGDDDGDD